MAEIDQLERELSESLAALSDSSSMPCGCHDKEAADRGDDPFSDLYAADDPGAELQLALGGLGEEDVFSDDALEFAVPTDSPSVGLEEIVALTQQYPGLKITFSN